MKAGSFFYVLFPGRYIEYFCFMKIYEAIKEMHELTRAGKSFSFSFMSYSYDRDKSHGPVTVLHAQLLPGNRTDHNRYSDYMLRYRDLDTYEEKSCWQPLLMEFNGQELEFS